MTAYYNEFDPKAAGWLRELIANSLIAPGDVDERSIEDVRPDDLRGYTQCHFFAGIGGWAYAIDLAGWPRDRPVWTGSCPCQPFSAAGKGAGFEDERHLWPAWQHLIAQCRPAVVFGEQVASKHADAWIDLVHADMEGMGYAFGCVPFPAAGIGAPHIRDRNYWLGVGQADAHDEGLEGRQLSAERAAECLVGPRGVAGGMAAANGGGWQRRRTGEASDGRDTPRIESQRLRDVVRLGYAAGATGERNPGSVLGAQTKVDRPWSLDGRLPLGLEHAGAGVGAELAGPANGHWRAADWIGCTDGKWRPVEPGTFPLAHGLPARVGRLRGYGNAIVPQQAAEFIRAYLEAHCFEAMEAAA